MGGRGFPYCTLVNAAGEVVWEVRPTGEQAWKEGLASARKLVDLRAQLEKKPGDKVLEANIALLDFTGRGQRPKPPVDEIAPHAKVEGADADLVAKFEAMRRDEEIGTAVRNSRQDGGAASYGLWKQGKAPETSHGMALGFYGTATEGAIAAGSAEDARKLLDVLRKVVDANPRLGTRGAQMIESLEKKIAGL